MTNPTAFLFGWIMIFLITVGIRTMPLVRKEIRARDISWRHNKSLRITAGIWFAVVAGLGLGLSVVLAETIHRSGVEQKVLWTSYSLLLVGEILVAWGLGRIRVPMLLCGLWLCYVIAWRFNT